MPANPAVLTVLRNLGARAVRERLWGGNAAQNDAIDSLAGDGYKWIGFPGELGESEATVRGRITSIANSARANRFAAFCGPNEINGVTNGNRNFGANWAADAVQFQQWVSSEVRAHTSLNGALVVGPVLKHNVPNLDGDVAILKAARSSGNPIQSYCDAGDFHFYAGGNGPGFRMDGRDSNGNRPPGIILGSDGKCSIQHFEVQRHRQIYSSASFPMIQTEGGWTTGQSNPSNTQAGPLAQEWYLRNYKLGLLWTAYYEAVDEYPRYHTGSATPAQDTEDHFGLWTLAGTGNPFPAGAKPAYTALQKLFGYSGSRSFVGVGWVEPQTVGVRPDVGVVPFSKAAGGWDVYLLHEGDPSVDFVTGPGFTVTGRTATRTDSAGNSHYTINLNSTMVVLAVASTAAAPAGTFTPEQVTV